MKKRRSVTIIGGGIVGCAIAFELSKSKDYDIVLLEKNDKIRGENQSSRNSCVIHAGIYYLKSEKPLKADLCVKGNKLIYDFCDKYKIGCIKTGKLVIATQDLEQDYLEETFQIAIENQVPGVRQINAQEAKQYEPNIKVKSALYVPSSGIVDVTKLVSKLHGLARSNKVLFSTNNKVTGIDINNEKFTVFSELGKQKDEFETDIVINSAGLYSDEIAKMINPQSPYEIDPVRGESAKFYNNQRQDIFTSGMNIYPAPYGYYNATGQKASVSLKEFKKMEKNGKVTKTVGVHLTPVFDYINNKYVIGNTVTIGPAKTTNLGKEDYGSCLKPPESYLEMVKNFFPNLQKQDIFLHQTGIMAVLKGHGDFLIERDKKIFNFINLIGIDSPGMTAALAIAKYVKNMVDDT